MARRLLLVWLLLLFPTALRAQRMRGVVLDSISRTPVVAATVTLGGTTSITNEQGMFELGGLSAGAHTLRVERSGYLTLTRELHWSDDVLALELLLTPSPVPLDTLAARAPDKLAEVKRKSPRAVFAVAGAQMAKAEKRGTRVLDLIRRFSGLRVGDLSRGEGRSVCIEATGVMRGIGGSQLQTCYMVTVFIDEIELPREALARQLLYTRVDQFESVEYLPPVDAATRFGLGAASYGALLLYTRGRGPYVDPARNHN